MNPFIATGDTYNMAYANTVASAQYDLRDTLFAEKVDVTLNVKSGQRRLIWNYIVRACHFTRQQDGLKSVPFHWSNLACFIVLFWNNVYHVIGRIGSSRFVDRTRSHT